MQSELKPCPGCNDVPDINDPDFVYPATRDGKVWNACCTAGGMSGGCGWHVIARTEEEAIALWNRRAGSDAVPGRQAVLAEVRAEVREMQDNLETFGEYGRETARVALDGVLDRIDELAAAPAPAPESKHKCDGDYCVTYWRAAAALAESEGGDE